MKDYLGSEQSDGENHLSSSGVSRTDLDIRHTFVIQNDFALRNYNLNVLLLTISKEIDFSILYNQHKIR